MEIKDMPKLSVEEYIKIRDFLIEQKEKILEKEQQEKKKRDEKIADEDKKYFDKWVKKHNINI